VPSHWDGNNSNGYQRERDCSIAVAVSQLVANSDPNGSGNKVNNALAFAHRFGNKPRID
jgi:hypothetical protein